MKSARPHQVTLLALTRDAVARMNCGMGTRNDVCNLVRQSQYLADAITDAQINAAVSGALDRLHYEEDPCVKFDSSKRLWVYLHSNRSIQELERLHAKQLLAPKKKRFREKVLKKPEKPVERTTTTESGNTVGADETKEEQSVIVTSQKPKEEVPRTIQLTQKQLIEITKKISHSQSPSLKLILKPPSGSGDKPTASRVTEHQVLTGEALQRLSNHLSAVSNRPIKIVHQTNSCDVTNTSSQS
uniref:Nuclear factor related to kappa-B-binding protein second winged helix domain-containing protein n=1 Tax=Ciona savignyi TaxID=51511 RepID=H2Y5X0_CIOSA